MANTTMATTNDDDDLTRALTASGCFVSLYLPTPSHEPSAARQAAVRWQNLRRDLAAQGADEATLAAVDGAVGVDSEAVSGGITGAPENKPAEPPPDDRADHADGEVLAVLAADGEILLRRFIDATGEGGARTSAVPWLTPLLAAGQAHVSYLVVLLDRLGADVWGVGPDDEAVEESIDGADHPIRRVKPGGWSQRRFQQRAINTWQANAAEVAADVAVLAERLQPERILVAGEEHAVSSFEAAVPTALAPRLRRMERGARGDDTNAEQVGAEVRRLVRTVTAEHTVEVLERFRQELGRQGRAVNGTDDVVAALQRGLVDTLLVHDDPDDDATAWSALDGSAQVARHRDELESMGVGEAAEARLVDVCVRSALLQGAAVHLVPGAVLSGAVGALLRAPVREQPVR